MLTQTLTLSNYRTYYEEMGAFFPVHNNKHTPKMTDCRTINRYKLYARAMTTYN